MSKCPKCDKQIGNVKITAHKATFGATSYPTVSFDCGSCGAVLSITFDPYKLSELIAQEVKKGR